MADHDLRALSAPIEALRADVKAAYARLDKKWEAVAEQLRKLPIPCNVSYTYLEDPDCPVDCECLEFRKWNGKKRICLASYSMGHTERGYEENCSVTPYEEWGGEQRVEMLKHVPGLFEAAAKRTQEFIQQTQE